MHILPQTLREAKSDDKLLCQISRYPRPLRKRVRKVAMAHGYLADLAFTYPMALFAIAANARGSDVSRRARSLVLSGAPLRAIAHELHLALWLRRLPPEVLVERVPHLPTDQEFTRRIVNFLPTDSKSIGKWLAIVDVAAKAHSRAFALWAARNLHGFECPQTTDGIAVVAVYAWYSARPDSEAGRWINKPWLLNMSLREAVSATSDWLIRLRFAFQRPAVVIAARPPRDNAVGVYHFHRLDWGASLILEGQKMRNCLDTYAGDLLCGNQVWSVRRGLDSVANLEIEFLDGSFAMPRLVQLLGVQNDPAGDEVWRAAYRWLARWQLCSVPVVVKEQACVIDPVLWQQLWQPYWQAQDKVEDKAEKEAEGRGKLKGVGFPMRVTPTEDVWLSQPLRSVWHLARLNKASG